MKLLICLLLLISFLIFLPSVISDADYGGGIYEVGLYGVGTVYGEDGSAGGSPFSIFTIGGENITELEAELEDKDAGLVDSLYKKVTSSWWCFLLFLLLLYAMYRLYKRYYREDERED